MVSVVALIVALMGVADMIAPGIDKVSVCGDVRKARVTQGGLVPAMTHVGCGPCLRDGIDM